MKKLKFLSMVLFAVLACVSFASCSDDDKDEPKDEVSIVGLWKVDGENEAYEFQANSRGIFYDNLSNMSNVECFDYTYDASKGTIVMKWHEDTSKPNWDSPITQIMNGTVRVLSNDKVIVTVDGYTMTLSRQK